MSDRPTVFVVDDDLAMRESVAWMARSAGLAVETFATADQFLAACSPTRPGCLVIDIRMPGMSGLELQEQLASQRIMIPVIIVTGHGNVAAAVRAMKGGAIDFIEKPFEEGVLLERIRHAFHVDAEQRCAQARWAEIERRMARLTPREREVMAHVVSGKPNKLIASLLGRSPKTIEIHRANVMKKMEATSLAELVRMARERPRAMADRESSTA
jgi:FixJ family two-component response regulator